MHDILVPPSFQPQLAALYKTPAHARLLVGEKGVQLQHIAENCSKNTKRIYLKPTDAKGDDDPAGSIKVDAVRMIYEKTRGKDTQPTTIIVLHIDRMSPAAQNALLKVLEEPSAATRFIATSHKPYQLLKTILSRMQCTHIPLCTQQQSKQLLEAHSLAPEEVQKLLFIGSGRPEYLRQLATTPKLRKQAISVATDARAFISGAPLERVSIARQYASTKEAALSLLDTALTIISFTMQRQPTQATLRQQRILLDAYENIAKNGSAKIHLLKGVIY